jgi:hypothetical protein
MGTDQRIFKHISRAAIRDGTINDIANGFFDGKDITNPKTVMGFVPKRISVKGYV